MKDALGHGSDGGSGLRLNAPNSGEQHVMAIAQQHSVPTDHLNSDMSPADLRGMAAVAPFEGAPGPALHAGSGWSAKELDDYASE